MPDWKPLVRQRLALLRLSPEREIEIVEELVLHLEAAYEDALAAGWSAAAAEARAVHGYDWRLLECELSRLERPWHPPAQTVEWLERRGGMRMESLWQDLRFGARMLLKQPGFTLIAIVTLALGIGANAAIFSVVNTVLLRPLPFKEPERLVLLRETKLPQFPEFAVSPANFLDWQKQNTSFERLVGMRPVNLNLTGTGDPERLRGLSVTEGMVALLGIQPQLGRGFLPEEHQPGKSNVVLLSHALWQRRFGGDPKIVNQTISLDGQSYTVTGVMPATFHFWERDTELWTPISFTTQQAQNRGGHNLSRVVGQLKPGVTFEQARTEMVTIAGRLAAQYPEVSTGSNVMLMPLLDFTVRRIKPALLVLLAAVAFVLLIACANVANLLLARAAGRQKELAIRTAMGAGRGRVVRQLLTESMLLSLAGGVAGLLLATWGTRLLLALAPPNLPRLSDVSLDGRVLAFTALVTLLTGVIFGLIPAWQATRPNLNETLKDAGRGSTEGGRQFVRNGLVVLEVAAALVLLVGAGLMIKSFWRLQQVDPGFNPDKAMIATVSLPKRKYPEEPQQVAFFQQLLEKVSTLPGVQSAGAITVMPLSDDDFVLGFDIGGRPPLPPGAGQSTNYYSVSADYFKTMGIPLRRGRLFTERDTKDAPHVALINETMAQRIFPNEDPLGKRINFKGGDKPDWYEIVGIVGDVKHYGLAQQTTLQTYEPYTQQTFSTMTLVARTTGDPLALSAAIRNAVLSLDKEQPVSSLRTLDQLVSTSIEQQQFSMLLLGVFAAVAMLLAAVGIYGVLSYAVTQRTHEIGIRMALGAGQREVLRLVVGQGMRLTLLGVATGLVAAFALTRLMAALLFSVSATDPLTFAAIAVLLLLVAFVACWIPARRATQVDPLIALRAE
ncbi:MAG: ABC transporter permease [Acidobacteria bacterium]|nr:ABC transporter permease [Acidobacteriota bacterium]MBI3426364.1 ABC transporter permease [Acidobacteriota bacterium]